MGTLRRALLIATRASHYRPAGLVSASASKMCAAWPRRRTPVRFLGFVLLASFATPASAADVRMPEEIGHPRSDRTYPAKLSCERCGGGLPWGGLRKSYS